MCELRRRERACVALRVGVRAAKTRREHEA